MKRIVSALAVLLLVACDSGGSDARRADPGPAPDVDATDLEVRASLSGEAAPGSQSYSYRGLYAGLTRPRLESRLLGPKPTTGACQPAPADSLDLACSYDARLSPDSAALALEVLFRKADVGGDDVSYVITAKRQLPLDVDGVRLVKILSDAFEKQTSLLDKREASYGSHQAKIRMGTLNGARQNFADVLLESQGGRELLTVKLSRSEGARANPVRKSTKPSR